MGFNLSFKGNIVTAIVLEENNYISLSVSDIIQIQLRSGKTMFRRQKGKIKKVEILLEFIPIAVTNKRRSCFA